MSLKPQKPSRAKRNQKPDQLPPLTSPQQAVAWQPRPKHPAKN